MKKIKTNEIFKSANFSNFARFKKIEEIMTYTREDALKLNDEKTKIEKVSSTFDFDILFVKVFNRTKC